MFLLRYLYDFARDNEIDIWIGITENVNVSNSSTSTSYWADEIYTSNKKNIPSNAQDSSVNWVDGNPVSTTPEGSYNNWFAAGDEHQPV